jgi:hypothetical protein
VSELHVLAEVTRFRLRLAALAVAEPEPADFASFEHLSQELKRAGAALGFDAPLARRLLSLRELLDSHLLTATAIASCDVDNTAALAMIGRGVDAVAAGLPSLDDPILVEGAVNR